MSREELNPSDLKAKLIAHFENPMPEADDAEKQNGLEACESTFERDLMTRILERGYRVRPQVGSLGYRIDMVVEGLNGVRLAVECDGDRYHGPEQWRNDMRRQRTLERVGWRFWRCFASSFYRDQDAVVGDLFERLSRMGIEPARNETAGAAQRYTERKIIDGAVLAIRETAHQRGETDGIRVGDKILVRYSDEQRPICVRLTAEENNLAKGNLSKASPLGAAILGAEEGDEIKVQSDDGRQRTAIIEAVERASEARPTPTH